MERKTRKVIWSIVSFISQRWRALWYFATVFFLTCYILRNWDYAIDFTPFSRFDGNNLLFVVWIMVIALPFLRIESGKVKAGLDTGSLDWTNRADEVALRNIKQSASHNEVADEVESRLHAVEQEVEK